MMITAITHSVTCSCSRQEEHQQLHGPQHPSEGFSAGAFTFEDVNGRPSDLQTFIKFIQAVKRGGLGLRLTDRTVLRLSTFKSTGRQKQHASKSHIK